MKHSKLTLALVATAFLQAACQTVAARESASAQPLTIQSYTASDAGFDVNSHLIMGANDAILVDAQFTRSEARKVAAMIQKSGKNLKTIFVTHGHPDHYFGLEILSKEFPKAEVLATAEVIADIQATAAGKLAYWKGIYKDDLADKLITPTLFSGTSFHLDGQVIEVMKMGGSEAEHSAVLYIPSTGALITGDLAYNQVHLWLVENRPNGWLAQLAQLEVIDGLQTVLPGHGPTAGADLLKVNEQYIQKFVSLTNGKLTKAQALKKLMALYPDYKLPIIAELSIGAKLK